MQKILGVKIDDISLKEATETLLQWSQNDEQKYVVTPNPEIILKAQENSEYLKVLNNADLNIPDGTGILWAAKFLKITENTKHNWLKILKWILSLVATLIFPPYIKTVLRERVTGADLMQNICKKCPKNVVKIFLLGAQTGVAEKVKEILEKRNQNLEIVGTYSGSPRKIDLEETLTYIAASKANMLFVAFGGPQQELWIAENLEKMPQIKVAMGVGGTFDFIADTHKRAPQWLQKIGLEWLYRLLQQPARLKRIYNATIKFPVKILNNTLK